LNGIKPVPRANAERSLVARVRRGTASVCLALLLAPSYAAAGDNEEQAELRRMLREVQEQNRELSRRLGTLEAAAAVRRTPPTREQVGSTSDPAAAKPVLAVKSPRAAPAFPGTWETRTEGSLDVRVKELEIGQAAQEIATRQIIQDSLSKTGPKINSFLSLSGVVEFVGSQSRDFAPEVSAIHPFGKAGPAKDRLALGTAELDFDIKVNDWVKGSLVLSYDPGTGTLFPTTTGTTAGVDRFTLDRAHISIGDFTQFPIGARFGREVVHFGTTTGVARLDTLSIGTPLTTAVFENRQTAAGLEFALPTPPLTPPPAPVVNPPVYPLFLAPLVSEVARRLGYSPLPQRLFPPVPVRPPVEPPPFYGSFVVYKGSEDFGLDRTRIEDFNATLGYRTHGHCGKSYEDLQSSRVCPWTFDAHVDYNTNVFESIFLHSSYLRYLNQIGSIPGIAASVKASFGPFALVGEVNSALEEARFVDGLGIARNFRPMAWQASLAYQFNWNPWIREIGAQGDFISVAYSGSQDMAGTIASINGAPTRIGFVPASRLLVTAGEWVMADLKVAVEYSANWDYSPSHGGTGELVHGIFGLVQLNF
jgi:hypothetical protein